MCLLCPLINKIYFRNLLLCVPINTWELNFSSASRCHLFPCIIASLLLTFIKLGFHKIMPFNMVKICSLSLFRFFHELSFYFKLLYVGLFKFPINAANSSAYPFLGPHFNVLPAYFLKAIFLQLYQTFY